MDSIDAKAMAARNLTEGATLEELREAARDLRARHRRVLWRTW